VPGPLFTFAAYLGAVMREPPNGWMGAAWALVAVSLPSFLLIVGGLPFWELLRWRASFQAALRGINAAVGGLVLAALCDPVWNGAIKGPAHFGLALVAFGLLMLWKLPPWLVVILTALGGAAIVAFA
jgi:chromate transporter